MPREHSDSRTTTRYVLGRTAFHFITFGVICFGAFATTGSEPGSYRENVHQALLLGVGWHQRSVTY